MLTKAGSGYQLKQASTLPIMHPRRFSKLGL